MCYRAQTLQDPSPYIGQWVCKVWSPNSLWLSGYSLLCVFPENTTTEQAKIEKSTKTSISQDWDGEIQRNKGPIIDIDSKEDWTQHNIIGMNVVHEIDQSNHTTFVEFERQNFMLRTRRPTDTCSGVSRILRLEFLLFQTWLCSLPKRRIAGRKRATTW